MHPVTLKRVTSNGRSTLPVVDPAGAMFAPAPGRGIRVPFLAYGRGETQLHVFTCPVSALTPAVRDLLDLWMTCRLLEALPCTGGVLDQPELVRHAFVMFESERRAMEREATEDQAKKR